MTCVSWYGMMAGAIWFSFIRPVSQTSCNAFILLAIAIAIVISVRTSRWRSCIGGPRCYVICEVDVLRQRCWRKGTRRPGFSLVRRDYAISHKYYELHVVLIPFMHHVGCTVDVFYRVIPHTKYQVVSVLPTVAPSGILVISRCAMSHGHSRKYALEAIINVIM